MSRLETKLELISNGMQLEVGLKLEINKLLHQLGKKGEVGYWWKLDRMDGSRLSFLSSGLTMAAGTVPKHRQLFMKEMRQGPKV